MASGHLTGAQLEEHRSAVSRLCQQHVQAVEQLLLQHTKLLEEYVKALHRAPKGGTAPFDPGAFTRSLSDLHRLPSGSVAAGGRGRQVVAQQGDEIDRLASEITAQREDQQRPSWRAAQHDAGSDGTSDSDEDCASRIRSALCFSAEDLQYEAIADQDEDGETEHTKQSCLLRMVSSSWFQSVVFLLIVLNAVFLGIEAHLEVTNVIDGTEEHQTVINAFKTLELVFLAVFNLEMLLRLVAEGKAFFTGPNRWWNMGEGFIVLFCVLVVVQEKLHKQTWTATIFIRNLRIFRAVRVIRIFRFLRQLRLMLFSILSCFISFSWALLLMLIMLATFAMYLEDTILVHFRRPNHIDRDSEAFQELRSHWKGLDLALISLIYSITGGADWADLAHPFWVIEPLAGLCYIGFILFIVFGLLNVLVGIFVEQAGEIAQWDHQAVLETATQQDKATRKLLSDLFNRMDARKDGSISVEDLRKGLEETKMKAYLSCLRIDMTENADVFFELLDSDGSSYVDKEEFVESCLRLQGGAKGLDLARVILETKKTQHKLDHLQTTVCGQRPCSPLGSTGSPSRPRASLRSNGSSLSPHGGIQASGRSATGLTA